MPPRDALGLAITAIAAPPSLMKSLRKEPPSSKETGLHQPASFTARLKSRVLFVLLACSLLASLWRNSRIPTVFIGDDSATLLATGGSEKSAKINTAKKKSRSRKATTTTTFLMGQRVATSTLFRDGSSHQNSALEQSEWYDIFLPLRNVCFTHNKLHFFQTVDQSNADADGREAYDFFQEHKKPLDIFLGDWKYHGTNISNPGVFNPQVVLHDTSMVEWMAEVSLQEQRKITLYHGTSFVVPPQSPHNQFHVFNDLIIPLFRTALFSDTFNKTDIAGDVKTEDDEAVDDFAMDGNTFSSPFQRNITAVANQRQVFLLQGHRKLVQDRVIMFDVIFKLFPQVYYPFESMIADASWGAPESKDISNQESENTTPGTTTKTTISKGVCFERYIWSQKVRIQNDCLYDDICVVDSSLPQDFLYL